MVSFVCDACQSTLKKNKVQPHSYSCGSHSFSCIDCGVTFDSHSVNQHNSCVSEAEKYQGKLYRGAKTKPTNQQQQQQQQQQPNKPNQQANGNGKKNNENGNGNGNGNLKRVREAEVESSVEKLSESSNGNGNENAKKSKTNDAEAKPSSPPEPTIEADSSTPTVPNSSTSSALSSVFLTDLNASWSFSDLKSAVIKQLKSNAVAGDAKIDKKQVKAELKQILMSKEMEKNLRYQWKV